MRYFSTCLLILCAHISPAAYGEDEWVKLDCNIVESESFHWAALEQDVILTTRLTTGTEFWPEGRLTLSLEDGTEVALGQGRKYIDDYDPNTPPTCQDHFELAKSPTVSSLQQYYPGSGRISQLITEADIPENGFDISAQCTQIDIARDKKGMELGRATGKEQEKELHGEFLDLDMDYHRCNLRHDILQHFKTKPEILRKLIRQNAPLLKVRASTYYNDIVAYDIEQQEFHIVTAEGC